MNQIHDEMKVLKRNGQYENVAFDKILQRVKIIGEEHEIKLGFSQLCLKVIDQLYDGIPTSLIDELMAQQCASLCTDHPDYGKLASALSISNLHKNTSSSFFETMKKLWNFKDNHNQHSPLLDSKIWEIILNHKNDLDELIDYKRDYYIDYFGFKTLERAYLMRVNKVIIERPSHLWLRVAIGIHYDDLDKVKETYDYMSQLYFTHATPTLFNAGTPRPQLSSCFLMSMKDDSIDGIYDTLKQCANISKWAGGIGLHIHEIRGTGSHIRGTNGTSNGIVPMLRNFNETARYVDQGGGKRNGSFAIYLSPWHVDICEFLELKKNHGDENSRARDLFYGLWINDEFMKRVKSNEMWYLMCPDECKGLEETYGEDFVQLYNQYIQEKKYKKEVKARDIWFKILESQMETGTPYLLYSDACNKKSNQKNLGVIKSSNLCTEIVEYSSPTETAVCNLASIALPKCIIHTENPFPERRFKLFTKSNCNWCILMKSLLKRKNINFNEIQINENDFENWKNETGLNTLPQLYLESSEEFHEKLIGGFTNTLHLLRNKFDYSLLHKITKVVARNLDKVIDVNYYPTQQTKNSNLLHRPIGIGVQGLADTFALMDLSFDSELARDINKNIFETIYHAAIETSIELAKQRKSALITLRNALDNDILGFSNYEDGCCSEIKYLKEGTMPKLYKELLNKHKFIYKECNQLNEKYIGSYSSFIGSPAHEGKLQFDLWNVTPSTRYDWSALKKEMEEHGLRNSLSIAPMPTASTSQILGNNECFEPFTSNIYSRRTLAGDYLIINKFLQQDLLSIGMWNKQIKENIIVNKGSVQGLVGLPSFLKEKYKIVWELSMKSIIEMAEDRGCYICQSMSMNLWMEEPTISSLTSMHFYAWEKGLKTGIYYLRRKPKHNPQQFTIEPDQDCLMCGS